jgi:hypothetical protein
MSISIRLAGAALAYGTTAVVQLGALFLLNRLVPTTEIPLVLQFLFFTQLLAGLEPGTAKAMLLKRDRGSDLLLPLMGLLQVPLIKAVVVTPLIGIGWTIMSHGDIRWWLIAIWVPLLSGVGFATAELRTAFDAHGRYGQAIWLKQGGLTLGTIALVGFILGGLQWELAASLSIVVRMAWLTLMFFAGRDVVRPRCDNDELFGNHWRDSRWIDFASASVLAALSGSIDRIVAFQFLGPQDVASYVLIYELFSKIWLLPYVLGPMIFAERATGKDGARLFRLGVILVVGTGASLLAITAFSLTAMPELVWEFFGQPLSLWPTLAFALALVLAALTQLGLPLLQGSGGTRAATTILLVGVVTTLPIFWWSASSFGLNGLLVAWLVKSILEFIFVIGWLGRVRLSGI